MRVQDGVDGGLALVTGASSGLGEALAFEFARNQHPLILTGRSHERLNAVAARIAAEFGHRPAIIVADLAASGAGRALADEIHCRGLAPKYIVNSAGVGLFGRAERLAIEDQLAVLNLNCGALTEVTLSLLPDIARQRGGILNVGSVGGYFPGPGMAVYFATKAYVLSLSQGLRAEYAQGRVHVTALCPGPVSTRFQARARMVAPRIPVLLDHRIDRIAQAGYRGLMRNRAVVTPGFFNALIVAVGRLYQRACTPLVRAFHFGWPRRRNAVRTPDLGTQTVARSNITGP